MISRAEVAAQPDPSWNLLKFHINEVAVTFLSYPSFDQDPHPPLTEATKINLNTGSVIRTDYRGRNNPPILHRKEAFLPPGDQRIPDYAALTRKEEEAGLYRDPSRIGLRVQWLTLLRRLQLGHEGHRLVSRRIRTSAENLENGTKPEVVRHRTAIKRYDLSKPVKQLLERGLIRKNETFFDEFGFEVPLYSTEVGGKIGLQNWNDSHPANYWSFTISGFLACEDAFAQLENSGLAGEDVLWVRFRQEEDSFDYEKLLRFTYDNCYAIESFDFVDKYVKGQEFPVVVIEGCPEHCNLESFADPSTAAEQEMWAARRQLYLCCSRATTFLYFVLPRGEGGITDEIEEIVRQVSEPRNPEDVTRRTWQIQFTRTELTRRVDAFHFQTPEEAEIQTASPSVEFALDRPVTVRRLAEVLKIESAEAISDLFSLGATFQRSTDLVADDVAKDVALKHGIILRIGDEEESDDKQNVEKVAEVAGSKDSLDSKLLNFRDSPRFPRHANIVRRYLAILNWFVETVPNGPNQVLGYRRAGASRRFFATSPQELAEHASSPNPHQIGRSGVWALTTTDSRFKREILDDLLRIIEISLPVRQKTMGAMR